MKLAIQRFSILAIVSTMMLMPLAVTAQTEAQRRSQTQNEWRNIATISGAVALLGLLKKDNTLTFAGAAGALYSLYRYDEDSKSKDRLSRTRAQYFSRTEFYRDGVRYNRRVVSKGGQKYYQFYRAPKSQQDWKSQGLHDNRNNDNSNKGHVKTKAKSPVKSKKGPSKEKSQGKGKGKGRGGD